MTRSSDMINSAVALDETEVRPTELVYATAIDYGAREFFAQQCKYTNAELFEHNKIINNYCEEMFKTRTNAGSTIQPTDGEVLCARFSADRHWYRVMVKSCDDQAKECTCYFIDYGNIETLPYSEMLRVSEDKVPTIKRAAFGFFASIVGQDKMDEHESRAHLDSLFNEYLMVRERGQSRPNHWLVEIPNVAYNTTYLLSIERALQTSS